MKFFTHFEKPVPQNSDDNFRPSSIFVSSSSTGGGAERAINLLASELDMCGLSVGLANINKGPKDKFAFTGHSVEIGRQWNGGLMDTVWAFLRFSRYVRSIAPRNLILNCDLAETFGALVFSRARLIAVEHSTAPWGTRRSLGRFIRILLSIRRVRWVSVGEHIEPWSSATKVKYAIPNLTTPILPPVQPISNRNQAVKRLVYVGRLTRELKQPEWLVAIGKSLNMEIVYIGRGPFEAELKEIANSSGVTAQFLGYQEEPWGKVLDGDLVVLPSKAEGDPLVAVEAISLNLPILLHDVPGLNHFSLPKINFCRDLNDFIEVIDKNRNDLLKFQSYNSTSALSDRDPKLIIRKWVSLLNEDDRSRL